MKTERGRCRRCGQRTASRDGEAADGRPRYRCLNGRCGDTWTKGYQGEAWDTGPAPTRRVAWKLTAAQHRILRAAACHKRGRVVGGDPRTRALLSGRGLIELDGYCYGPLFKITEAGRQAVLNRHVFKEFKP